MGCVNSSPNFCCASNIVTELANNIREAAAYSAMHQLLDLTDIHSSMDENVYTVVILLDLNAPLAALYMRPLTQIQATPLRYADVCINDFISLVPRHPFKMRRIHDHLFSCIYCVFCPNGECNTDCQEPDIFKKIARSTSPGQHRKWPWGG